MLYFPPDRLSVAEALPLPLVVVIIIGLIFLLLWVVKQWSKDGGVDPKKHWKSPSQSKPPTPTKRPFDPSGRPNKPERPDKEERKHDKRERK